MLDKLPAQLRHFILIVGGTFLGVVAKAILAAQGVTGVHWAAAATLGLNTAVVTGATSFMLLNLTPLTKQYGAFSDAPPAAPQALQELSDAKQALADVQAQATSSTDKSSV